MKLKDLNPNPRNPRTITDEKLNMLGKSLDEFGDISGICFNVRTKNLFGGHQRIKKLPPDADIVIMQKYDTPTRTGTVWEGHVIVAGEKFSIRGVDWSEQKEAAGMIAANNQGGDWYFPVLNDLLLELDQQNYDMELVGYDDKELEKQLIHVSEYDREPPSQQDDEDKNGQDQTKKHILEVQFPSETEMMGIHDDLLSRGYLVKVK